VSGGPLGEGSNGVVRRGVQRSTGAVRAVKTVQKKQVKNLKTLKQEVQLMAMMDHPNIIKLFETYEDARSLHLVMELCAGGELFDRIVEAGRFTEREAALVMRQILRAVCYMHELNVAHRDLKPENFLFHSPGPVENNVLKLIDFGLSCVSRPAELHREVVGTPQYVAPQVLSRRYDRRCDLWSCGVIMYTLLCGRPAFPGKTEEDILAKVRNGIVSFAGAPWTEASADAKNLIRMLLKRNPAERFTADQALAHPWFRDITPSVAISIRGELGLFDRFRSFKSSSTLKKVALHAIADQLSPDETRHLRELFDALDTSGSGVLSPGQFRQGLEQAGLAHAAPDIELLLRGADLSSSGVVDYTEFIAAALDTGRHTHHEACWGAFQALGVDGEGRVSEKEMLRRLSRTDSSSTSAGSTASSLYNSEATEAARAEATLNFGDFVALVRNSSHDLA